jgi:isopenicillin-N epimerase
MLLLEVSMGWNFGAPLREHWFLDPAIRYLNHGTVGAPPRAVIAEQDRIRRQIERQPAQFLVRDLAPNALPDGKRETPHMREAAARVAPFFSVRGEDLVFTDNATSGICGILRSAPLRSGDEILVADQGYGGINNGASFAARERGLSLQEWHFPTEDLRPQRIIDCFEAAITSKTRLAVIDQIHSGTGLVLPIEALVEICRSRGVLALVDGAHVPGCLAVDIPSLGAEYWVGNLHKWAWSPRSSAVFWCAPEQQADMHPAVISWGLDLGFADEFDLLGTRDPSAHLSAPFALDLLEEAGGAAVLAYNRGLARQGAECVAEATGATLLGTPAQWAAMVPVLLPPRIAADAEGARMVKDQLLFDHKIEAQVTAIPEGACLRVAAQIYNELDDYRALASALNEM